MLGLNDLRFKERHGQNAKGLSATETWFRAKFFGAWAFGPTAFIVLAGAVAGATIAACAGDDVISIVSPAGTKPFQVAVLVIGVAAAIVIGWYAALRVSYHACPKHVTTPKAWQVEASWLAGSLVIAGLVAMVVD